MWQKKPGWSFLANRHEKHVFATENLDQHNVFLIESEIFLVVLS